MTESARVSEPIVHSELHELDRPTGPIAAAMLAVGIGAFVLGLLTTLSEASTGVHDFLEFDADVGPLSGKTILAVIAYVVSWAALHAVWRRQTPVLRPVLIATAVLVALGVLGTFPTFFQAFTSE
jgi:hypothetical protein